MIRCSHCATDNLDGSEYCDECGTKLSGAPNAPTGPPVGALRQTYTPPPQQFITQVAPPPPPSFTKDSVTPKPATPYTPPPPPGAPPVNQMAHPQATHQAGNPLPPPPVIRGRAVDKMQVGIENLEQNLAQRPAQSTDEPSDNPPTSINGRTGGVGSNTGREEGGKHQLMSNDNLSGGDFEVRAKLVIQRGGKVGKEFPLLGSESMIGRWDADGGIFPDVDLDQDDPEAKVSRRHARIQFVNNQFLIEDLGSTNGTFINRGPRLLPGNKQPLNHGDEIIVGKTFLKFVLN